ncbi:glycosyltransferase [Anaerolineales bacterium HSG6]|nr:glycosyltransferase [Anaerolineales bacterium HSG6]
MTVSSAMNNFKPHTENLIAPAHFMPNKDLSIIIPVKDNHRGVNHFLKSFIASQPKAYYPREIIIVYNDAKKASVIPQDIIRSKLHIRLLSIKGCGPAKARNAGANIAKGNWLLFSDSDCVPSKTYIRGYLDSMNGAVGYAGNIRAVGKGILSRYYDSQRILIPPSHANHEPQYLVTANTLIWKPCFHRICGFNQVFSEAGGEDIDLAFRLSNVGRLSYALKSTVLHNFNENIFDFISRFVRYGRGNRLVERLHDIDLSPKPFAPYKKTQINSLLAFCQYMAMKWGYWRSL